MHPINSNNFGTNGIAVYQYYNGSTVGSGYIYKQIGSNKFIVTQQTTKSLVIGDPTTQTVALAPTTAIATTTWR
jgi:hypothetical protein